LATKLKKIIHSQIFKIVVLSLFMLSIGFSFFNLKEIILQDNAELNLYLNKEYIQEYNDVEMANFFAIELIIKNLGLDYFEMIADKYSVDYYYQNQRYHIPNNIWYHIYYPLDQDIGFSYTNVSGTENFSLNEIEKFYASNNVNFSNNNLYCISDGVLLDAIITKNPSINLNETDEKQFKKNIDTALRALVDYKDIIIFYRPVISGNLNYADSLDKDFAQIKEKFDNIIIKMFIGLGFMIFFTVLLCFSCGKKTKDGEIVEHKSFFDKIWVDVNLFCAIMIQIFIFAVLYDVSISNKRIFSNTPFFFTVSAENIYFWILILIIVIFVFLVLLQLILSIVANIKHKTVFKNTLLGFCFKFIIFILKYFKLIYDSGILMIKFIINILAWFFINIFFFCLTFSLYSSFCLFLMIIFNILSLFVFFNALIVISMNSKHLHNSVSGKENKKIVYPKIVTFTIRFFFNDLLKMSDDIENMSEEIEKKVADGIKNERLKNELIANVSHDLRTPITSLVNYIDLLQKEELNNPTADGYIKVLDEKTQRLKTLVENLFEATKAATGNVDVLLEKICVNALIVQTLSEFNEKLKEADLMCVTQIPDEKIDIYADGRLMWRVFENLMNNIVKYSMTSSRIYISVEKDSKYAKFTFKNISANILTKNEEELMLRFSRDDQSRNTEGSGLGLSIAESLTILQAGQFNIQIDGDLFKAIVKIPLFPTNDA